jgi:cell division protein FtsQ
MQKLKNILLWSLLLSYIVVMLGFVEEYRKKVICNRVLIMISDEEMNKFLKQDDVKKALDKYKLKIIGTPIDSVNTFLTEQLINKNPAVRKSAAYTTIDGKLCIKVDQRKPILRVINKNYQNYYIDETGQVIPMLRQYAALTLIANGNISEPFEVTKSRNIFPTKRDSIVRPNTIYDLYYVAKYIDDNDFWRSQIEQIFVDSHNELELIPRVGSHIIKFGRADNLEYKFAKLKSLYRTFNEIGWNNYKTINLKYKDQVVCTKR